MRTRSEKPDWQKKIAKERIDILLGLAKKEFKKNKERSKRYVSLARKIALRYNIRQDKQEKNQFCKNCFILFIPGKTFQTRLDSKTKTIVIKCLNCNKIYRRPYRKMK